MRQARHDQESKAHRKTCEHSEDLEPRRLETIDGGAYDDGSPSL